MGSAAAAVFLVVVGGLAVAGLTVFAATLIDLALSNTRAKAHSGIAQWLTETRRFVTLWVVCAMIMAAVLAITA